VSARGGRTAEASDTRAEALARRNELWAELDKVESTLEQLDARTGTGRAS
jgi:hypothetical protein